MKYSVDVRSLTKIYGEGRTAVKALDNVHLGIERGDFVALMGPSGSGKSTLLNVVGGLDWATTGEVYVDGVEVTALPESQLYQIRRQQVGFVFQAFHLSPTLSVLDNVLLPALPIGIDRERRQRAAWLLDRVGMAQRATRRPSQLSAGERQRAALARALIMDPPLILADEPTGNLDSKTGSDVIRLMEDINRKDGKTIVLVTHDARVAHRCNRTVYLRDGTICSAEDSGLLEDVG